ncbi:MAG: hypothetical protein LBD55_08060 [Treponema sp.]|jgi:hypothetical protein|nr:hypothetical protein [Treponema sp.]
MMKQRWVLIILLSLLCVVVFSQVATSMRIFSLEELPLNFVAAFLEAVITAVITVVLLTGQSAAEEIKERNVKVFEKKSELFLKYIDALWEATEDQTLTAEEYEALRKDYSVRLMIYLKEQSSRQIAEHLKALGTCVDSLENEYNRIKEHVFGIINVLSDELNLGGRIDLNIDKELEKPIFPILFKQVVLNEFNRALKSQELNEGAYCKGEDLVEDAGWAGEYLSFDFRRFKGCKLILGPFSKYCPDMGGLWMWLLVDRNIHEIDRFRYSENASLIEIWDKNKKWAELTGRNPTADESYTKLGEFKRPGKEDWGGLYFDDPGSLETYRSDYQKAANILGKRADYWLWHGRIEGRSIKDFLKTYLGRDTLMIKEALTTQLNWHEYKWNRAVIGEAVNDVIFMGYERGSNWLGFVFDKMRGMRDTRDALMQILNQPEFQDNFGETVNNVKEYWLGKSLQAQNFKDKPDEMADFIVEKCRLLKEKVQAYLDAISLGETIRERLINELGFEAWDTYERYKDINGMAGLYFSVVPQELLCWFGFWSDGHIKDGLKEQLEETLNSVTTEKCFDPAVTDWDDPDHWLAKKFSIANEDKPGEMADFIVEKCRLLEEKTRKKLKTKKADL